MEYDYHGIWDGFTGHNAPLFASPADPTKDKKNWNIVSIMLYYLDSIDRTCILILLNKTVLKPLKMFLYIA